MKKKHYWAYEKAENKYPLKIQDDILNIPVGVGDFLLTYGQSLPESYSVFFMWIWAVGISHIHHR